MSTAVAEREPPADPPAPPRLREGVRTSLLTFLGVRIGMSGLSWIAATLIAPRQGLPTVPGWAIAPVSVGWRAIVTATERQDAAWFLRIATGGYAAGDGSAAFFPGYPMAIKVVAWLPGLGPLGAALVISNACFLGALVMLHGLTRLEGWSVGMARTTVLLVAIFPTAFFFLAPYSEAPFLLLTVSAFWFARRDRWALAGLMGALAALTRSIGLLLVLALAVEAIQRSREDGGALLPRLAAAVAVAAGPALYFLYWGVSHSDLWAPVDAQREWQRELTFPLTTLANALTDAWRLGTYWLIDVVVVGVVVIAVLGGIRLLRGGYLTYSLASLALPLSFPFPTRPLVSMPRFVAVIFPAFWVIARTIERKRLPEPLVVAAFAGGYAMLAALFINWWYVF
jgi:hypothetical protein